LYAFDYLQEFWEMYVQILWPFLNCDLFWDAISVVILFYLCLVVWFCHWVSP
jgi:hypothetical protein